MSTEGLVKKWRGQHGKRYLFSNAEEMADALGRLSAENEALRAQVEALTKERDDLHTCLDGAGKGQQMVEAELNKYAHALVDLTEVVCPGLRSGDILADAKTALSKATTPQALTRPAVPEFSRIAQRKLDEKLEEGFQVNGYAIQRDSTRGFIDSAGFVGWWTPGVHALAIATIDAMERPAVPEGWKPALGCPRHGRIFFGGEWPGHGFTASVGWVAASTSAKILSCRWSSTSRMNANASSTSSCPNGPSEI